MSSNEALIQLRARGEEISYTLDGRTVSMDITWSGPVRIDPEGIKQWEGSKENIPAELKGRILQEILGFVVKSAKPIVMLESDDPDRDLWEEICKVSPILRIEYTSEQEIMEDERSMYLEVIQGAQRLADELKAKKKKDLANRTTNRDHS
jgi:hypothetical protein